jgi:hypothetical protein
VTIYIITMFQLFTDASVRMVVSHCVMLVQSPCPGAGESVASRLADQDARLNQIIDWGQELEAKLEAARFGTGADR